MSSPSPDLTPVDVALVTWQGDRAYMIRKTGTSGEQWWQVHTFDKGYFDANADQVTVDAREALVPLSSALAAIETAAAGGHLDGPGAAAAARGAGRRLQPDAAPATGPVPDLDQLGGQVAALSRWIDESYGPLDGEARLWRRVTKPVSEAAEAYDALSGWIGENPRKGVTHTREDVIAELLDTAVAALGAVEHLTGNEGRSLGLLAEKVRRVADRAGLSIAGDAR